MYVKAACMVEASEEHLEEGAERVREEEDAREAMTPP